MIERQVTAIVLAGGRSSRFGRDKLIEPIDGRPLLHHAIDAVRPLSSEVIVVVAPGSVADVPPGVRVVHDRVAFDGPLAGVLAALEAAAAPVVVVVGGDMPDLVPGVIRAMLAALDEPTTEAATLDHAGRPRPLPMTLRRDAALSTARRLIDSGERRLAALPDALRTTVIAEGTWRALDPDARTMRDIDTPADLP
jgi:molybdopterin-guanine dinucleotide biosynthesis protein A